MASKFHHRKKGLDRAIMSHIVEWYTPRMIASFALTLYENTDMSVDEIKCMCKECDQLWRRAEREGWDIKKNCFDLTGIDVVPFSQSGNIDYGDDDGGAGDGN